jgi:hypothetical protein
MTASALSYLARSPGFPLHARRMTASIASSIVSQGVRQCLAPPGDHPGLLARPAAIDVDV